MTARGAADFLTRSTAILGGIFIFLSIALAAIAGVTREAPTVDTSLAKEQPYQGTAPVQQAPAASPAAPASNEAAPAVPIAQ
jgi:preprotein translocase subunit SecG